MSELQALLGSLQERIGTDDEDHLLERLRRLAGDPTAGDDTNALIHRLYDRLGGQPSQGHTLCVPCSFPGPPEEEPVPHNHAHVLCRDGTTTGEWTLDCTHADGWTFSVTGADYDDALRQAIAAAAGAPA